ncbi:MAG: nucleotidyltransferase family protein [Sphingopyxis sp.]
MTQRWTAVILAGQRPGTDPLAAHFGETYKALIPIAGEPMVTHVVRTLSSVVVIGRIIVLAQQPDIMAPAVAAGGHATLMVSQSGISQSILSVAGSDDAPWPLLVTTADHPLLTRAMVEAFIAQSVDADVAVAMVARKTMIAQFPGARRTWLRFADGAWSGANLFALMGPEALPALRLWAEAEADRKRPWRLFSHFGLSLALRAITRTIGLAHALNLAGNKLGMRVRLVAMADPMAAIDVDKLLDHQQAESLLKARANALVSPLLSD